MLSIFKNHLNAHRNERRTAAAAEKRDALACVYSVGTEVLLTQPDTFLAEFHGAAVGSRGLVTDLLAIDEDMYFMVRFELGEPVQCSADELLPVIRSLTGIV